jgi:hypothetical protein
MLIGEGGGGEGGGKELLKLYENNGKATGRGWGVIFYSGCEV